MTPTPETIAFAEKIAARMCSCECGDAGSAALTAIMETSEKAAELADVIDSIHIEKRDDALHEGNHHGALTQARRSQTAEQIASAIRNGEHLRCQ